MPSTAEQAVSPPLELSLLSVNRVFVPSGCGVTDGVRADSGDQPKSESALQGQGQGQDFAKESSERLEPRR